MNQPVGRRPSIFKQRDVTRLIKAAVAAGIQVARVEIDQDGKLAVVTAEQDDSFRPVDLLTNEWDDAR